MTASNRCAVAVNIATPDRGKITFMWMVSEERARDLLTELSDRIGEPDNEFFATADVIDAGTRIMFQPGGVVSL